MSGNPLDTQKLGPGLEVVPLKQSDVPMRPLPQWLSAEREGSLPFPHRTCRSSRSQDPGDGIGDGLADSLRQFAALSSGQGTGFIT